MILGENKLLPPSLRKKSSYIDMWRDPSLFNTLAQINAIEPEL